MEALTSKQLEVAQMLVSRRSYEAIGAALGIKKHTVKAHAEQIYRRLGIYDGREELRREFRLQLGEFVPESLEGYWLSRFEFVSHKEGQGKTARLTSGTQINLEVIERSSDKFIAHTGFNYTARCSSLAPAMRQQCADAADRVRRKALHDVLQVRMRLVAAQAC